MGARRTLWERVPTSYIKKREKYGSYCIYERNCFCFVYSIDKNLIQDENQALFKKLSSLKTHGKTTEGLRRQD